MLAILSCATQPCFYFRAFKTVPIETKAVRGPVRTCYANFWAVLPRLPSDHLGTRDPVVSGLSIVIPSSPATRKNLCSDFSCAWQWVEALSYGSYGVSTGADFGRLRFRILP